MTPEQRPEQRDACIIDYVRAWEKVLERMELEQIEAFRLAERKIIEDITIKESRKTV